MKNSQKGFVVSLLIAIIALLVIGGGMYVYNSKKTETPAPIVDNPETPQSNQIQQQTNAQTPPVNMQTNNSNWKTYTNTQYGFEIKYPKTWQTNDRSGTYMNLDYIIYNSVPDKYESLIITVPIISNQYDVKVLSTTNINGYLAYIPKENMYVFQKNGFQLIITKDFKNIDNNSDELQLNQILSTFKFTK